jgi:hypothetical protein
MDRRRHSSILDVKSFRGAVCDRHHYSEVAKVQYQVTIKNKFAALENLDDNGDINRTGTLLERTYKFRPKRVSDFVNQSLINHGLMKNI